MRSSFQLPRKAEEAFAPDGMAPTAARDHVNRFVMNWPKRRSAQNRRSKAPKTRWPRSKEARSLRSRVGDDSVTHKKRASLWAGADLDAATFGEWYKRGRRGDVWGREPPPAAGMGPISCPTGRELAELDNKADLRSLFAGDPSVCSTNTGLYSGEPLTKHGAMLNKDAARPAGNWFAVTAQKTCIDSYTINGRKSYLP